MKAVLALVSLSPAYQKARPSPVVWTLTRALTDECESAAPQTRAGRAGGPPRQATSH